MMQHDAKTAARRRRRLRACAGGIAGTGAEEVRRGRLRYRDQDRQHQSLLGQRLRLWRDRQDDRGLLQDGQRRRRHQRPQDHLHHLRRRLLAAQDRGDGAQAGGGGQGAVRLPDARHAAQHRDPEVPEREEGAAAVRRDRRLQVGRPQGVSLDDGLAARLRHRSPSSTPSTSWPTSRTPRSAC